MVSYKEFITWALERWRGRQGGLIPLFFRGDHERWVSITYKWSYIVTGCNKWVTVVRPCHDESLNKVVGDFLGLFVGGIANALKFTWQGRGVGWFRIFCLRFFFGDFVDALVEGWETGLRNRDFFQMTVTQIIQTRVGGFLQKGCEKLLRRTVNNLKSISSV